MDRLEIISSKASAWGPGQASHATPRQLQPHHDLDGWWLCDAAGYRGGHLRIGARTNPSAPRWPVVIPGHARHEVEHVNGRTLYRSSRLTV